LFNFLFVLI